MRFFTIFLCCFALSFNLKGQNFTVETKLNDHIVFGTSTGDIYSILGEERIKLSSSKGSIVGIDSFESSCYAISSEGIIHYSKYGSNWKTFDFSGYYADYYPTCAFIGIAVAPDRVAILGRQEDGSAVLYISTSGTVWAQRELKYKTKNSDFVVYSGSPLGITYDRVYDEFKVFFEDGVIMTVPSCSHCNKLIKLSGL